MPPMSAEQESAPPLLLPSARGIISLKYTYSFDCRKLNTGEKGKPIERWGRKATGLKAAEAAYDGWAAAERMDF